MKILGLEKVSFVDYEGKICATIFTGGCNFRCPFCHNSSLVNCTATPIGENDVLTYLIERKTLLDGVTIIGGEPCLQKDLPTFARKIKDMGYKIKLDTNGTFPEIVEMLISEKLIDYVAIDIKNAYSHYKAISGVINPAIEKIKQTLSILKRNHIDYELRTTLVNEFHSIQTITQMAEDLNGEKILYLQKFVDSGDCLSKNLSPIPKEKAITFQKILSNKINNVKLRGY